MVSKENFMYLKNNQNKQASQLFSNLPLTIVGSKIYLIDYSSNGLDVLKTPLQVIKPRVKHPVLVSMTKR